MVTHRIRSLVSDLPVKLFNQLQDVKERRLSALNVLAFAAAAVMVGSPTLGTLPVWSEAVVSRAQLRAMNLARGTAVAENGGLSVYRPEPCMVQTSTGGGACFVSGGRGFTFNFLGGRPGWPEDGSQPTTETEIEIGPRGTDVVKIWYNGVPRSGRPLAPRDPLTDQ